MTEDSGVLPTVNSKQAAREAELADRAWAAWSDWYPDDEERRYSEAHAESFVEGYKRAFEEMREEDMLVEGF